MKKLASFWGYPPIRLRVGSVAPSTFEEGRTLIQEALSTFQISPNLTDNIVQAVKEKGGSIKPDPATKTKPIIPWATAASTLTLIAFILGIGNEYINRFQRPYSLEATSEMKVDIVEIPVIPIRKAKPAIETQLGRTDAPGNNSGTSPQADTDRIAALEAKDPEVPIEETQQTQIEVLDFFQMPESGHMDYTVVHIDATAFEDGGTLTIDIRVGSGEAAGSFDLFDGDSKLPRGGIRRSSDALAHQWGIPPGGTAVIAYQFDRGQIFRLGAASDWQSKKGSTNAFYAQISIR